MPLTLEEVAADLGWRKGGGAATELARALDTLRAATFRARVYNARIKETRIDTFGLLDRWERGEGHRAGRRARPGFVVLADWLHEQLVRGHVTHGSWAEMRALRSGTARRLLGVENRQGLGSLDPEQPADLAGWRSSRFKQARIDQGEAPGLASDERGPTRILRGPRRSHNVAGRTSPASATSASSSKAISMPSRSPGRARSRVTILVPPERGPDACPIHTFSLLRSAFYGRRRTAKPPLRDGSRLRSQAPPDRGLATHTCADARSHANRRRLLERPSS